MRVGILGAGAYAIALADIVVSNNHKVTIWSKFDEEINYLKENRSIKSLNNYIIPNDITFTNNLDIVMNNDLIIFAVPGEFIKEVSLEIKNLTNKQHFCIASKGLFKGKPLFQIVREIINTNNIGVISGPTFAVDIVQKVPIGISVSSLNNDTSQLINKAIKCNRVGVEIKSDIVGISVCGAIKNIIAIGNGIIQGLNLPISTQSLFITKSIYEIKEIIKFYDGQDNTIVSLAGIGDLILTCTSKKSRNFSLGLMIGKKDSKKLIDEYIDNTTIEGITALKQIENIIINKKINIPIINCIYNIIYNEHNIDQLIEIITK